MNTIQYQIIRYIPDRVAEEFINVGVIVFQADIPFLQSKFINKYSRISQFFSDVNGPHLLSTLKQFEKEINRTSDSFTEIFQSSYRSLEEITRQILQPDDSALVCSEIHLMIDLSPQVALDELYERLVNKYIQESEKTVHDDKYAWKKVYKKYFDKYQVTQKLKSHVVKTSFDEFQFDKAWKNDSWHCYQTLSFDLQKRDTIEAKLYKWSGILVELEKSNQELNLYFLTVNSRKHRETKTFIHETLCSRHGKSLKIKVIDEEQAEVFAQEVSKEIEQHAE